MRLAQQSETKQALGGDATITVVIGEQTDAEALFAQLWRHTFQFERRFSRFLPESELSRFNEQAGQKAPISAEFGAILRAAQSMAARTEGLFNPFVLPALQRAGYVGSAVPAYADDAAPDYRNRSVTTADKLEIHDDWARIPYGTALDLGGCGKGYLADELGTMLQRAGVTGYWVNLSGDIACYGTTATGEPIAVAIQPAEAGEQDYIVVCPTTRFGVATSGTFQRKSQRDSLTKHHIIDARTGAAAETDIRLATVCAPSAIEADVLASCAVILGSELAPAFLQQQSVPSWLLQSEHDGEYQRTAHGPHVVPVASEVTHA